MLSVKWGPMGRFDIKTSGYHPRDFQYKDEAAMNDNNGNSFTGKKPSLHWIGPSSNNLHVDHHLCVELFWGDINISTCSIIGGDWDGVANILVENTDPNILEPRRWLLLTYARSLTIISHGVNIGCHLARADHESVKALCQYRLAMGSINEGEWFFYAFSYQIQMQFRCNWRGSFRDKDDWKLF